MKLKMVLLALMLLFIASCSIVNSYIKKNPHLVSDQQKGINAVLDLACADPTTANAALAGTKAEGKIDFVVICK